MLPASKYKHARRNAAFHLQVELIELLPIIKTPCNVKVNAQVVTVFRAPSSLCLGDRVAFTVAVTRPSDDPGHIPYGGQIWTNYDDLVAARFMEVFLDGDPPELNIALWQSKLIDSVSITPVMSK